MELENFHYRLQHNPASDPNKQIPIYSQLLYFLNTYEGTQVEAELTYKVIGDLIKMGTENFEKTVDTPAKLRSFLSKKLSGPGSERALELISSGISFSNPLIERKAIIALASGLADASIKIKFPGGKLVLQTSEGIHMMNPGALNSAEYKAGDELSYKFEDVEVNGEMTRVMYAEVLVPRSMLTPEQIENLGKRSLFLYGDGIGFRIPSTELHSAVPLRVVGTYSATNTNVIIAPKELVPIHGSDFDVDALMVITRENYNSSNSSFTSAEAIRSLFEDFKEIHNALEAALSTLSLEDQLEIRKYSDAVSRRMKLLLSDESLDKEHPLTLEEQTTTEAEFNSFIHNPNWAS